MIVTHKRLLVDVFLTRSLSKSLAFCEFASVYFKSCAWPHFQTAQNLQKIPCYSVCVIFWTFFSCLEVWSDMAIMPKFFQMVSTSILCILIIILWSLMKYVDFELTMKGGKMYATVYFILFCDNCRLTLKAQTMFVRMEQQETFRLRNLWKMKRTESKRKKKRKSKTIPWRYNKAVLKCRVPHS